jgi:hypothetical protein
MIERLPKYLSPGILGFYSHFEVTEIFMMLDASKEVFNVFTIVVAEERDASAPRSFLGPRIRLKGLPDRFFGVERYVVPVSELLPELEKLDRGEGWREGDDALQVGALSRAPVQFVPGEAGEPVPWNSLLKNNFWNGSHLFEWVDQAKMRLAPLFDTPSLLQELSESVFALVPMRLAAMTDRLGNVVVQLPVTVITSNFGRDQSGDFIVTLAWHPKATARVLQATCSLEFDGVLTGFGAAEIASPQTRLSMQPGRGAHRGFIWDEANEVVLCATGPARFMETIGFNIAMPDPEPRTFTMVEDGSTRQVRVPLTANTVGSVIGRPHGDDTGGWTLKRIYTEQASLLRAQRRFVQYPEVPRRKQREKALEDLRSLMRVYGRHGVWLWDPYLRAHDVQEVLYHCPYSGSDLRALTSGRKPASEKASGCLAAARRWLAKLGPRPPSFRNSQRLELEASQGNMRGLRLEYRIQFGNAGWRFHDRFIIFPSSEEGALAWSLGTSVNSLGIEHHILQRVDDGQLIADAFAKLWNELAAPEHLIWKLP